MYRHIIRRVSIKDEALCYLNKYLALKPSDIRTAAWALYSSACLHALAGRTEDALSFFEQALKKGLRERKHITEDTDLDQLRNDPRFTKLMKEYFPEVK